MYGLTAHCAGFLKAEGARRVSIEMVGASERYGFQPATVEEIKASADGYWERPAPGSEVAPASEGAAKPAEAPAKASAGLAKVPSPQSARRRDAPALGDKSEAALHVLVLGEESTTPRL